MAKAKSGVVFGGLRGKVGNVVLVETPAGLVVRAHVVPANPRTPAQEAARERQAQASRAWSSLSPAQQREWEDYAQPLDQRPMNAFTALAVRVLLANPSAVIPVRPPDGTFPGDRLGLSVVPGPGGLRVTASEPNGAGVATELLLQPLASPARRTYPERYRHARIVAFTAAQLATTLPAPPGPIALAYRFTRIATGQTTELVELGKWVVG